MINLAFKDIRHNLGRFLLTTAGISLLLIVVMGMGGIYRGLIQEATLIIDRAGEISGWCRGIPRARLPRCPGCPAILNTALRR